jgi:peptidyl-dipeptidase A
VRYGTAMCKTFNSAKICPYNKPDCAIAEEGLSLEPNITYVMAHSRDYDELSYVWKTWHDNVGKELRSNYTEYVNLMNKAASENGLTNAAEMWQLDYEDGDFIGQIDKLWEQVEPLYNELHTFMRYKLKYIYGKSNANRSQAIFKTNKSRNIIPIY